MESNLFYEINYLTFFKELKKAGKSLCAIFETKITINQWFQWKNTSEKNNKSDYEHNMTNTAGLKKWAYGVNYISKICSSADKNIMSLRTGKLSNFPFCQDHVSRKPHCQLIYSPQQESRKPPRTPTPLLHTQEVRIFQFHSLYFVTTAQLFCVLSENFHPPRPVTPAPTEFNVKTIWIWTDYDCLLSQSFDLIAFFRTAMCYNYITRFFTFSFPSTLLRQQKHHYSREKWNRFKHLKIGKVYLTFFSSHMHHLWPLYKQINCGISPVFEPHWQMSFHSVILL